MKTFLLKALLFAGINLVLLIALLEYASGRKSASKLPNWKTESDLMVMRDGQHYDFTILGTSRGRTFSRDSNHVVVEQILGKHFINLSKGASSGVIPAELFLRYFYSRGNSTDHIVYCIDPWVVYDRKSNEENGFFTISEPFELGLLTEMIKMHLPVKQDMMYCKSIWSDKWKTAGQERKVHAFDTLRVISEHSLDKARAHYDSLIDMDNFARYSRHLEEIIQLAHAHGAIISFVIVPSMLHHFPGKPALVDFLTKQAAAQPNVYFYDFSEEMADRRYFYDHNHFNRNGVVYFTANYLQKIVLAKSLQPAP